MLTEQIRINFRPKIHKKYLEQESKVLKNGDNVYASIHNFITNSLKNVDLRNS